MRRRARSAISHKRQAEITASTVSCGAMSSPHAARYDGSQLGAVLDCDNTASDASARYRYRSAENLALLVIAGRLNSPTGFFAAWPSRTRCL
jgi:hypothetical protein